MVGSWKSGLFFTSPPNLDKDGSRVLKATEDLDVLHNFLLLDTFFAPRGVKTVRKLMNEVQQLCQA